MNKTSMTLACVLGLLGAPAQAAGENAALKNTPSSKFNAEDYALMKARVDQALKAEKDGETLAWNNDKSGASGTVTALNRLTWNDLSCRRLRIVNNHGSTTGRGVYKFCEKPPGRWKLVGLDGAQQ